MDDSFLPDNLNSSVEHSVFNTKKIKKIVFCAIILIVSFLFFYFLFLSAPTDFPVGTIIKIEEGNSLRNVSLKLKNEHLIRSRFAFEALVIIFGREKRIIFSDYYFENKLSVYEIAKRIAKGEHHLAPIAVTIPEGFNIIQIADTFSSKLLNFDRDKFLFEAKDLEGYLFPDTYFFFITVDEKDVLESMRKNFNKKIKPFLSDIVKFGKTEREIIVMASIIEKEAKGDADREFISGILWKRIAQNMRLQVDVAPVTYKVNGLPQNPIVNPGLASIKAAIYPKNVPYLFFLYDKNSNIHYAKNFSEHQANIRKYLK